MANDLETAFHKHRPTLADDEVIEAAQKTRIVLSFNSQPIARPDGSIMSVVIKFALGNRDEETMVFSPYVCELLRLFVERLNATDWKLDQVLASRTPH